MRTSGRSATALLWLLLAPAAIAQPAVYDRPEAAVEALVGALETRDREAVLTVFGPEFADLAFTGDDEEDRATWRDFLQGYRAGHRLVPAGDGRMTLLTGRDRYPFPAELVRGPAGWSFDSAGARDEIEARRIGQNELDVIDILHGYVRAQARFRAVDYDGDGVMEFAASVLSSPGGRDGLYWPDEAGAPESPIGDFMARAADEGYSLDGVDEAPEPYLGYYYRILQEQGASAPGGAFGYMVAGHMLAGHALLAYPADYGVTGIMSFVVGEAGVVYQADLGPDTGDVAAGITAFDPGGPWSPLEE